MRRSNGVAEARPVMPLPSAERDALFPEEREDQFYRLLAGAAGMRAVESAAALELPRLLARRGAMSAKGIIAALDLHPHRGLKWLLLLEEAGLLESSGRRSSRYRAGPLMRAFFHADGALIWFYQDFLRYFRNVLNFDLVQVLRGLPVPAVPYPPRTPVEVEALEGWMRTTAAETMDKITKTVNLDGARCLLDVAGGDGTMAIHYARNHPRLRITVFNLPASARLVRQNVAKAGLGKRIDVVEGDFRSDPLPRGYDLVQFSRVLADWPESICRRLLTQAKASLVSGGQVVICEPLSDDNPDLSLAWHFSYVPYDDFGASLYKPLAVYRRLLEGLGFEILQVRRKDQDSIHAVIVARRRQGAATRSHAAQDGGARRIRGGTQRRRSRRRRSRA